jgi:hypothetical protein
LGCRSRSAAVSGSGIVEQVTHDAKLGNFGGCWELKIETEEAVFLGKAKTRLSRTIVRFSLNII